MSQAICDASVIRNVILESQHLLKKSTDSIENIVSDICGLQYDPYPAIHLNQYIMLWNRKKDFRAEQLDVAAYQDFKVVETWTFKRNMFLVPRDEYSLYKFNPDFKDYRGIDTAIEELAAFHEAKEIVERG